MAQFRHLSLELAQAGGSQCPAILLLEHLTKNYIYYRYPRVSSMERYDELIGNKPAMKIMGFLIENSPNNYNKTQIITELEMGRKTLYDAWQVLDKYGLIATISSDRRTRFYILNKDSSITKALIKLYTAIEAD